MPETKTGTETGTGTEATQEPKPPEPGVPQPEDVVMNSGQNAAVHWKNHPDYKAPPEAQPKITENEKEGYGESTSKHSSTHSTHSSHSKK